MDEEIYTAIDNLDLNKNSIHNIDYLICDIKICKKNKNIIEDFINTALKYGNNTFYVETTAILKHITPQIYHAQIAVKVFHP